ncbi:MAG: All-trans-nonaprenyl-diphosphate synthase (geranyl-diphosphate specific) [Microgenomates bacterium OLB23]|nr:MAG: All-trans-nonaprenyl-diphosphate synthase (geranyl-diphosphate specific) [Microgenomates bacterium OLB23]
MQLFEYVKKNKQLINNYLGEVFAEKIAETDKSYAHLYESLRDFSVKGKHLRGCFFLLSYEMAGGNNVEAMLPAAAAIEVNGSALLIHDDIMDNDVLRRGGKSMFAQYIDEGQKLKVADAHAYGVGSGILIGDIGIIMGFELLHRAPMASQVKNEVSRATRAKCN